MMSPSDPLRVEEEGADVDGANRDGAEWEGRAVEFDYHETMPHYI